MSVHVYRRRLERANALIHAQRSDILKLLQALQQAVQEGGESWLRLEGQIRQVQRDLGKEV